jgi:hypothetical protein
MKLKWDQVGEKVYETGVDRGVLFIPNSVGVYNTGFAWNGLTTVTESPTGAEANKQYADNIMYLNLLSTEMFAGTIEAFTYPDEWAQCDGSATPQSGITVGQQSRKSFGLCYRTRMGNDLENIDFGYKLHLVYGALAAPSEKAYATMNDSPEAIAFSWDFTTSPVDVVGYKPTSLLTIDSTKVNGTALAALEDFLYGTSGTDPSLPAPAAVLALFAGTITTVTPTAPSFNSGTHTITIPTVTGVTYMINDEIVTGAVVIAVDTVVHAVPNEGYIFPEVSDSDWFFDYV